MDQLTRRLFLKLSGRFLAGISLGLGLLPRLLQAENQTSVLNDHEIKILRLLIHDLFPHKGIADGLYHRAAIQLSRQISGSPKSENQVREGLNRLDRLAGGKTWLETDSVRRLEILKQMETSPFFKFMRDNAARLIYRDPGIWDFVDYGGSSIEQGGYLHRGFNDIDWLPRVN